MNIKNELFESISFEFVLGLRNATETFDNFTGVVGVSDNTGAVSIVCLLHPTKPMCDVVLTLIVKENVEPSIRVTEYHKVIKFLIEQLQCKES